MIGTSIWLACGVVAAGSYNAKWRTEYLRQEAADERDHIAAGGNPGSKDGLYFRRRIKHYLLAIAVGLVGGMVALFFAWVATGITGYGWSLKFPTRPRQAQS